MTQTEIYQLLTDIHAGKKVSLPSLVRALAQIEIEPTVIDHIRLPWLEKAKIESRLREAVLADSSGKNGHTNGNGKGHKCLCSFVDDW